MRRLLFLLIFLQTAMVFAQPTIGVLQRVLMIRSGHEQGTTFSLDVDQREYWITAKHILTGAKQPPYGSVKSKSADLYILNPGAEGEQWLPVKFSVLDPGVDIDIVVLAPPQAILSSPLSSVPADATGLLIGGDCEFLGFPYGGGWRMQMQGGSSFWVPFVKHCNVSGSTTGGVSDTTEKGMKIWVLDGINNPGFSGGPVIFGNGGQQKIFGVISGFRTEPTDVVPVASVKPTSKKPKANTPAKPKEVVNVNSGFIVAFDIEYAIKAIQQNPIGPLRKAN